LDLLHSLQLAKMSPEEYLQWQRQIDDMRDRYREARQKEDNKALSKAERDYAGKVGENIAKALPVVSKGIISAQKAFAKGDYVTGAAAIMDICAAVAPVISSLLAAAGPEGMLVGALFSVIGQILSLFGPKEPSQIEQIETLLKDLANERELEKIQAVHDEVSTYTRTLIAQAHDLRLMLEQPLNDHEDYKAFYKALKETTIVLKDFKPHDSVTSFNTWTVINYLKNEVNQDVAKWPEVLGVCCQTYSDLVSATMTIPLLAYNADMRQRLHDVDPANTKGTLSEADKRELETSLLKLQAYADVRKKEYASCNATMLGALKAITPAARDRGLYVHLGDNNYLYGATGRKGMRDGAWKKLGVSGGNLSTRVSISVPKDAAGSLRPQYHLFVCKAWIGGTLELTHAWLDTSMNARDEVKISGERFEDVWSLPAPKEQRKPRGEGASFVYAAHDHGGTGSVQLFELDGINLTPGGWQPATKAAVTTVRAVTHPPFTLADDPDKGGLPPGSALLGGVDHYNSIVYGALRSSPEIYLDQSNTRCYVPSPWGSYTGIHVDPYYLWVFGPYGFACATHASVISCVQGQRPSPRWMSYAMPGEYLFDSYQLNVGGVPTPWETSRDRQRDRADQLPPFKGLVAFTACMDGTLLASMFKRKVYHPDKGTYEAEDSSSPSLYTSVYTIDLEAGSLAVEPWKQVGGAAFQVQKLPIPCWSLFEKLKANLQAKLDNV
jgi:hypothetical protein